MSSSVFVELQFWLLIVFSLVLPISAYVKLLSLRSIARRMVVWFGIALILIACIDVVLLQALAQIAKTTPSMTDDVLFTSRMSIALYVFPVVFGGLGVNLISHVLLRHLYEAEKRFNSQHELE
jgi:hypothetical protein